MSNVAKGPAPERPTIPAEVADIIEAMRKIPYCNNRDITNAYDGDPGRREKLRAIPFDTLLAALVNGYERELSEEERTHDAIKREWINRDSRRQRNAYCDGFADGIEFVLGETSILIEGVNA